MNCLMTYSKRKSVASKNNGFAQKGLVFHKSVVDCRKVHDKQSNYF